MLLLNDSITLDLREDLNSRRMLEDQRVWYNIRLSSPAARLTHLLLVAGFIVHLRSLLLEIFVVRMRLISEKFPGR